MSPPPPRVGISACLLGNNVRYDGGHRREDFLSERLREYVTFVTICPEVEIGLGTPRPRIDLHVGAGGAVRMMQQGHDLFPAMEVFAARRTVDADLSDLPLSGYLFKARSPSCGLGGVRQLHADGEERADGVGVFAQAFRDRHPEVPCFEETALADPFSRESVVTAIFTAHRWRAQRDRAAGVAAFHRTHRTLFRARDGEAADELDRLAATAAGAELAADGLEASLRTYGRRLVAILTRRVDRSGHLRAVEELVASFERMIAPGGRERREAAAVVQHLHHCYRQARADLRDTLAGLAEVAGYHAPELVEDAYFCPHPPELNLYAGL